MATTFENPANGYREEVNSDACYGMFFFGALYLVYKGLWKHVFIWPLIVGIPTVASGGVAIIIVLPLVTIIYTMLIQDILDSDYLRRGWKEVPDSEQKSIDATNSLIDEAKKEPWRVFNDPVASAPSEFKKCPFCAEQVRQEAIKCKHCHSDLSAI